MHSVAYDDTDADDVERLFAEAVRVGRVDVPFDNVGTLWPAASVDHLSAGVGRPSGQCLRWCGGRRRECGTAVLLMAGMPKSASVSSFVIPAGMPFIGRGQGVAACPESSATAVAGE